MGTNDKRRRWLGSEVEDTVGERRKGARINAGDRQPARKRGSASEVEGRTSAVIADGDGSEGIRLIGQGERGTTAHREGLHRDDATQGLVERRPDEFKAA